jgi:hypothetical protein
MTMGGRPESNDKKTNSKPLKGNREASSSAKRYIHAAKKKLDE